MLKYFLLFTIFLSTSFCTNSANTQVYNNKNTGNEKVESTDDSYKTELLKLVNDLRKKGCRCGRKRMRPVPPLKWNPLLEKAALAHARDMEQNDFFKHKGSNGSKVSQRIEKTGYDWRAVAENIFWGSTDAHQAFLSWKKSKSHCKTMMNGDYKEMGAAFSGKYWVQDFGTQQ